MVRQELLRLYKTGGKNLTPQAVVKAATNPNNVLHGLFEWNDAVAAEQYRLDQARQLIRVYQVDVITETVTFRVPEWVRNPDLRHDRPGYALTAEVKTNRQRTEEAISDEINRLASIAQRVREMALALGIPRDQIEDRIAQAVLSKLAVH